MPDWLALYHGGTDDWHDLYHGDPQAVAEVRLLFSGLSQAFADDPAPPKLYDHGQPPWAGAVFDETSHRWKVAHETAPKKPQETKPSVTGGAAEPQGDDHVRDVTNMVPPDDAAETERELAAAHPAEAKSGVWGRVRKTLAVVRDVAYSWALSASPAALRLLGDVVDSPDDMKKFGFNPTGSVHTTDMLHQHTGIGTHLAVSIASKVLGRVLVWAKPRRGEVAPPAANSSGRVVRTYSWSGSQTRSGKLKAVGSGPHQGKTLYGERARRALEGQKKTPATAAEPHPVTPAAYDPKERQRAYADAGMAAYSKLEADPSSLTGKELETLADHLKTMRADSLKALAGKLGQRMDGSKKILADRLADYARTRSTEKPDDDVIRLGDDPGADDDVIRLGDPGGAAQPHLSHANLSPIRELIDVRDADHPAVRRHVADLAKVPGAVHGRLRAAGLKGVYLGDAAVPGLDDMGALKGVRPRGWDEGDTWDQVSGCHAAGKVIAGTGRGGSTSLVLHEYGHAAGFLLGLDSHPELAEFHRQLFTGLPPYFQQDGPGGEAGMQELWAETFARYWAAGGGEAGKAAIGAGNVLSDYADWFDRKMQEVGDGGDTSSGRADTDSGPGSERGRDGGGGRLAGDRPGAPALPGVGSVPQGEGAVR